MPIKTLTMTIVALTFSFQLQATETKEHIPPLPEKRQTSENSSNNSPNPLKKAHDLGIIFDEAS